MAADVRWGRKRIVSEAEIATSLFVQLHRKIGEPITVKEKVARRNQLLALGHRSMRDARKGKRRPLNAFQELEIEQGFDDLPNREHLDDITRELGRRG